MPPVIIAAAIGAGTAVYQTEAQKKEASKQRKHQEALVRQGQQYETLAGEHWEELNAEQMELQSRQHSIQLLSDIIKQEQEPAPQIVTLPSAKTYSPVEEINRAIEKLFSG